VSDLRDFFFQVGEKKKKKIKSLAASLHEITEQGFLHLGRLVSSPSISADLVVLQQIPMAANGGPYVIVFINPKL